MNEAMVLEELFGTRIISVIRVLLRDSHKEHYLQELSQASSVPLATCSRILHKLEHLDIIEARKISKFSLYRLKDNEKVKYLSRLFKEEVQFLKVFAHEAAKIKGINAIILHGKESADRANVLLIGSEIDPGEVKSLCADIKEKYNFLVSPLSLTHEQYSQMSQMGLYSGQKKVLYERGAK